MRKIKLFSIIILCLGVVTNLRLLGQPEFQFTIQTWATYTSYDHPEKIVPDSYQFNPETGQIDMVAGETIAAYTSTQLGWGIRRARLRGKMTIGRFTAFIQYAAAASVLRDAQIDVELSKKAKLRMGRFVGPGSQAAGRTSHTAIDFAERSIVGRMWASVMERADYRTYGLSLIGKAGFLLYEVMASNGAGDMSLKPYNTKSSNSDEDTGGMPQMDFMVSSQITKGIKAGVNMGLANKDRINKSSLTGFLYLQPKEYTKGKVRAKFDIAQVTDKTGENNVNLMGWGAMAFVKAVDKMEIGVGYATWDPNTDLDKDAFGNFKVAFNYSPNPEHWKDTLFKLVAVFKNAQADNHPYDPFQLYLIWQVYMH